MKGLSYGVCMKPTMRGPRHGRRESDRHRNARLRRAVMVGRVPQPAVEQQDRVCLARDHYKRLPSLITRVTVRWRSSTVKPVVATVAD